MRLVVVGLGIQGRKRLAVAGPDVVATVDPVEPTAGYRSVQEVPLDSFDAACVCTPDPVKLAIVEYLLGYGKHVLVEKPLVADDEALLRRLADLAERTGAVSYTAYNHRFEPCLVLLKEILAGKSLGNIYLVRGFYGNGTARDVRSSPWRDRGLGVLGDLGSHLLDLCHFNFGPLTATPEVWSCNRFENAAPDHVLFGFNGRPAFEFEATLLCWRNAFRFDVYGDLGSAHVNGLCKWGPSTLTVRKRVLPSGRPGEESRTLVQDDPTWAAEYRYFADRCRTGGSNIDNDIWINGMLNRMAMALGTGVPANASRGVGEPAEGRMRRV